MSDRIMRATVILRGELYDVQFDGCEVPWTAGFDLLPDLLAELDRMGGGADEVSVTIDRAALAHHAVWWKEATRPSLVDQEEMRIMARAVMDDVFGKRKP